MERPGLPGFRLQIRERLTACPGLDLISIASSFRKDPAARTEAFNQADAVILCLPDGAAREAVSLIERDVVKTIRASTPHHVASGEEQGFQLAMPSATGTARL